MNNDSPSSPATKNVVAVDKDMACRATSEAGKDMNSSDTSLPIQSGMNVKLEAPESSSMNSTVAMSRKTSKEAAAATISSKQKEECGGNSSLPDLLPVQKITPAQDLYGQDNNSTHSTLKFSRTQDNAIEKSKEGNNTGKSASEVALPAVQKNEMTSNSTEEEDRSTHGVHTSSSIQETHTIGGKLKDGNDRSSQNKKVTADVEREDMTPNNSSMQSNSLPVQQRSTGKVQDRKNATPVLNEEDLPSQSDVTTKLHLGKGMNCGEPKQQQPNSLHVEEKVINNLREEGDTPPKHTTLSIPQSDEEEATAVIVNLSSDEVSSNIGSTSLLPIKEEKAFEKLKEGPPPSTKVSSSSPLQDKDSEGRSPPEKGIASIDKTFPTTMVQKKKIMISATTPVVEEKKNSEKGNSCIASPNTPSASPSMQVKPVVKHSSFADGVEFPNSVAYYKVNSNFGGDRKQNRLKLKKGGLVLVMKAEDPNFWLIKVRDGIGWALKTHLTEEIAYPNGSADGPASDGMVWEFKKEGFMSAASVDTILDIELTTSRTFDHEGSKVTAFFIQVSAIRKGVAPNHGEIWVISKTVKAFNRLRVAWEEEIGSQCTPYEPPPVRWSDCSEADWDTFRCSCIKQFLNQMMIRPELKCSQELHHFLTTHTVDLSGGIVNNVLMKPYLDIWLRTSSDPSWTVNISTVPSLAAKTAIALRKVSTPTGMATDGRLIKQTIPGLKPGDESFGRLSSQRPRVLRSDTFAQISALAAVTKQEALLDYRRRVWVEDSVKVKLLTQGGRRSIIRRRSDKNVYNNFYNDGGEAKALDDKGSFNQMKFETRFNLEKIMYGHMDNLARDSTARYAAYASILKKKEEIEREEGGRGAGMSGNKAENVSKVINRRRSSGGGHVKKNTQFVLDALVSRLDKIHRTYDIQTSECLNAESGLEMCQYMSKIGGRFTMPLPAQLMALQEMTATDLDRWITVKWPVMGAANTYHRLREIETFLERKRIYARQLLDLVDQGRTQEEVLLIAILGCSRLIDAVEAEEEGLWTKLSSVLDALNLRRCRLIISVMAAEARSEEASRGSRKSVREVHADVQRSRKALNFVTKAVAKIRSGVIRHDKFDQLRERLDAAADAAHEEYRDVVRDAKPAKDFAEEAIKWMESCESFYEDLDELGTIVYENIKEIQGAIDDTPEKQDMVLTVLQESIEVTLQMASNARDLSTQAADNARFDMQTSFEEVSKVVKIIHRVELEERRARNECDAMEGHPADEDFPFDCPYATWSADMREMMQRNLRRFRKAAQYRQCCNNDGQCSGARDLLLMQVLLAKVQVIRDVKKLQEDKKVSDQLTEHEKNVKASKVKLRESKKGGAAAATANVTVTSTAAATGKLSSSVKSQKETKAKLKLEIEAVEEVLDDAMEDVSSAAEKDGEHSSISSHDHDDNEVDEESLLESDDDILCKGPIVRRKQSSTPSTAFTPKQLHGTYVPFRRQHQMRSSLIRDSLGKGRVSIGRISKVEALRPITPGSAVRKGVCQTFMEGVECSEAV